MEAMRPKEILTKKPFMRITPVGYMKGEVYTTENKPISVFNDPIVYKVVTQSDFMREFYPTGHRIFDQLAYPDRKRTDPETGQTYIERMVRCAFAFQQIITVKQLVHLCGNSVQFETMDLKEDNELNDIFFEFKKGWASHNMEICWYEGAKSAKITGDSAIVGYMNGGKFYWKLLSFLNGDTLFPHYNNITGKLELFARQYNDTDSNGNTVTQWIEVWDDVNIYRYKKDSSGLAGTVNMIKEVFGLSGYKMEGNPVPHGFSSIPVAYKRCDDVCWANSQDTIEQYELAFSQMSQNNSAYAFPIMYFKGDNVNIVGDGMTDSVKAITMGADDEAGFMDRPNDSNLFSTQLDKLYRMIYEQSFAVIPPEVKSGDLPGVAIKLLYSPAVEKAMTDAQEYNEFINKIVEIFKEGYGIESGKASKFNRLNLYAWIQPYIHQNLTELVSNLAMAVQNGFLSRKTAAEYNTEYSNPQEWDRIMREKKEEQQMDILVDTVNNQPQANVEVNEPNN